MLFVRPNLLRNVQREEGLWLGEVDSYWMNASLLIQISGIWFEDSQTPPYPRVSQSQVRSRCQYMVLQAALGQLATQKYLV